MTSNIKNAKNGYVIIKGVKNTYKNYTSLDTGHNCYS